MIDAVILWGLFARVLAIVYVIAFLSMRAEIVEWAGARDLNPVREKLARFREHLGRWRDRVRYPALFWLDLHEPAVPGFVLLLPLLGDPLPDPNERIPVLTRQSGGGWLMDGDSIIARRTAPQPQTESVR